MNKLHQTTKKGQAMVELALVLFLFLVIVMAIFDIGRAVYYYTAVQNAAREGARYGSINPNTVGIQNAARSKAIGLAISTSVNITTDTVAVTVSYNFSPATPVLRLFTGSNVLTLRSVALMRIEK
jgi:Flp pilus assembly protein TadG